MRRGESPPKARVATLGCSYQSHYCTFCCQLCCTEERPNKPVDVLVVRVMLVVVIWDLFPLKESSWNYWKSYLTLPLENRLFLLTKVSTPISVTEAEQNYTLKEAALQYCNRSKQNTALVGISLLNTCLTCRANRKEHELPSSLQVLTIVKKPQLLPARKSQVYTPGKQWLLTRQN